MQTIADLPFVFPVFVAAQDKVGSDVYGVPGSCPK